MHRAYVGIDLGTTFSGVVVSAYGNTQAVRDPITGQSKFPPAHYYTPVQNEPAVGMRAISEAVMDQRYQFLIQQFKRQMGTREKFPIDEGRTISAEQASVAVLQRCRDLALDRLP